jgi:hypothetical protein
MSPRQIHHRVPGTLKPRRSRPYGCRCEEGRQAVPVHDFHNLLAELSAAPTIILNQIHRYLLSLPDEHGCFVMVELGVGVKPRPVNLGRLSCLQRLMSFDNGLKVFEHMNGANFEPSFGQLATRPSEVAQCLIAGLFQIWALGDTEDRPR